MSGKPSESSACGATSANSGSISVSGSGGINANNNNHNHNNNTTTTTSAVASPFLSSVSVTEEKHAERGGESGENIPSSSSTSGASLLLSKSSRKANKKETAKNEEVRGERACYNKWFPSQLGV